MISIYALPWFPVLSLYTRQQVGGDAIVRWILGSQSRWLALLTCGDD